MSLKFKAKSAKLFAAIFFLFLVFITLQLAAVLAQANKSSEACPFDEKQMQFAGTAVEQARCLLRPVGIQGALDGAPLTKLPAPLEKLIGQSTKINRIKLREFLRANQIDEMSLGGSLDAPLSTAKLPNGELIQALYFLIHDTSDPYLKDAPFPNDINEITWSGNNLEKWLKLPVAHVFVNRLGESITTTNFADTVAKGWGTKFARDYLKANGKGLQLHIELVQPRRRDPKRQPTETNDAIAPQPGFSDQQYERLTLLYICASVRRGSWLIPAFHAAVDAGINDAHDDPQNFELNKWAKKIGELIKHLK